MSGWFKGSTGTWYSGDERGKMAAETKKEVRRGNPKAQKKGICNRCGLTKGYIGFHNHDYSHPVNYLEELCWTCHQVVHAEVYAPEDCKKYWEMIENGHKPEPLVCNIRVVMAVLKSKYGIFRPAGFPWKIMPPKEILELYDDKGKFRKEKVINKGDQTELKI